MPPRARPSSATGLIAQVTAVLAGFVAFAVYPPRNGAILLLPLDHQAGLRLGRSALASGATLLGRGPTDLSLIVEGDRERLGTALAGNLVLMVAAPRSWCSDGA